MCTGGIELTVSLQNHLPNIWIKINLIMSVLLLANLETA